MTTTLQAHGGGAQPASIDTSGKVAGGAAQRVYGFDSVEAAQAAGYVCEGGPAMSVALITDAQISSGAWKAEGDPAALVVYTAPANMPVEGGYAVPVYPVNGWGSSTPAPVAPLFDSAEIGAVNASTLVVTFDANVDASNYATGVTIKVNGTTTSITNAIRQSDNHTKVNYTITVLWHGSGDAVTWEYASGSGNIVAESDSTPLGDVTAQSVTNNCGYAALLDLRASQLALSDGDPVSTWPDSSGQGNDFTQSGTARPTYKAGGGIPYLDFDGVNDWLLGQNFANDLASFAIFIVANNTDSSGGEFTPCLCKVQSYTTSPGWIAETDSLLIQEDGYIGWGSNYYGSAGSSPKDFHVFTLEKLSNSDINVFRDGSDFNINTNSAGTVTTFANSVPVTIGTDYDHANGYYVGAIYTILLYSPAPNATDRAAIETWLATNP